MRDALTIVNERMAAIRTQPKSIDARIDQKELLKLLLPDLFPALSDFKQEFGQIRVRNARPFIAPCHQEVPANTEDGGEVMVMIVGVPND